MYAYIKGELIEQSVDHIVLENNGIGYRIFTPQPKAQVQVVPGEEIKVYTYLNVKEDALTLFGFYTKDDLEMFKALISVNKIGPKGALSILSTLSTDDLRFALLSGDDKLIAKAPGIGLKTAQKAIIELKDKVNLGETFEHSYENASEEISAETDLRGEVIMALTALGYDRSEVLSALKHVEITTDMDVEMLLKLTLKEITSI